MKDNKLRVLVHRRTPEGKLTSYFHTFKHGSYHLVEDKAFAHYDLRSAALDSAVEYEVLPEPYNRYHYNLMCLANGPVYKLDLYIHTGDDSEIITTRYVHYLGE